MEALQSVELTGTNRPCGLTILSKANIETNARSPGDDRSHAATQSRPSDSGNATPKIASFRNAQQFPVALSRRPYPIPSRTRKSSSSEPMVLHGSPCGRVGRRRVNYPERGSGTNQGPVSLCGRYSLTASSPYAARTMAFSVSSCAANACRSRCNSADICSRGADERIASRTCSKSKIIDR